MKIAVFSDSHDHLNHVQTAVEQVKARSITTALHLGDVCAPPIFEYMADCGLKWFTVFGNCDGDRMLCYQRVEEKGTIDMVSTEFRELELEGRKLFLTHYPRIAEIAAVSGEFDAVFHGHNHQMRSEVISTHGGPHAQTLLGNPGELGGFRFGTPSYGIYDTEDNSFELITLV
jgi:uncharacterized protein